MGYYAADGLGATFTRYRPSGRVTQMTRSQGGLGEARYWQLNGVMDTVKGVFDQGKDYAKREAERLKAEALRKAQAEADKFKADAKRKADAEAQRAIDRAMADAGKKAGGRPADDVPESKPAGLPVGKLVVGGLVAVLLLRAL